MDVETKFNWNECGDRAVANSLKVLRRDCHINNSRKGLHVAGGLRPIVLGPSDCWR